MEKSAASAAAPAMGIVQGGLGIFGAMQQNRAIQSSIDAAAQEAAFTQEQIALQAGNRLAENQSRMAQVRGRVRVQTANGEGGEALVRQAAIDAARNEAIIKTEQGFQTTAVRRGYQTTASNLSRQYMNPLLAAISGVISGGVTGLQIGGAFDEMNAQQRELDRLRGIQ